MKIYLVPTHHWDPYWTHAPEVSEKMGVRNLRKALDIIRENPDFKYVISQAYLWELFKRHSPERVEELKKRVKEKKIILACGGYVNPDFNLPSGESLIRQLAYSQRVWQEEFGVRPEIAWIQDSFGQPASLPQIFSKLGVKFHTSKRGPRKELPAVFIWQGVDGSRVIFDRQPLGHHGVLLFPGFSIIPNRIKPLENLEKITRFPLIGLPLALIALYLPDLNVWFATKGSCSSFKSALKHLARFYPNEEIFIPHGFGFDGALPVGYIDYLCKVYSKISKNEMFIASPSEFLKRQEQRKSKLKIVTGELNGPHKRYGEGSGALPAVASTRMDVKLRARKMERLLYSAELLEAMKFIEGKECRDLTEIWKLKFLTDFHDGISGSLTDDNYRLLKEKGMSAIRRCQEVIKEDLVVLSHKKTVFNPLPWERKDLVRTNGSLQLVTAPSIGINPFEIEEPKGKFHFNEKEKELATPFYKVSWKNELNIAREGRLLNGKRFARFRLQQEKGDTYFWNVSGEEWDKVKSAELTECGNARAILEIKSRVRNIKIKQRVFFYLHTPRIDFATRVRNREKDVRLQTHLPFNLKNPGIVREIPAGFLEEGKSPGQAKWQDVCGKKFAYYDDIKCCQNWLYIDSKEEGVALFNDGLPEHEIVGSSLFLTLLRCVGRVGTEGRGFFGRFRPTEVPWRAGGEHSIPLAQEQGTYELRYAVFPGKRESVAKECYEFLFPLEFCRGKGKIKNTPIFSISDKNLIPLAVKKAGREEGIAIRLLETEGKGKYVRVKIHPSFKKAELTDLMEEKVSDLPIRNNAVEFLIKPQEISTLVLKKEKRE